MKRILVVANETVAGRPLIEAVQHGAEGEDTRPLICPRTAPARYVINETRPRRSREPLELTRAQLREDGIDGRLRVMTRPHSAIMDALGDETYDEIISRHTPRRARGGCAGSRDGCTGHGRR